MTRPLCLFAIVGMMLATAFAQPSTRPAARPNVIIVLADDLGYGDLGCYGGEVKTPNLDALAADGLRFTNIYNMARCCPTRGSILTGQYPHTAGVGAMTTKTDLPAYAGRLSPDVPTIAEVLKTAGYSTAIFGKWHVSNTTQRPDHLKDLNRQAFPEFFSPIEQYPTRRGFDKFWGCIWGVENFFNPFSLCDGETPVKELPKDFYLTDAINDHAAEWIKSQANADKPYFIYLAHNAPHWPLHALPADVAKYDGVFDGGWDAIRHARYDRQVKLGVIDPKTAPWVPTLGKGWDKLSPDEQKWQASLYQAHAAMIDRLDQGLGRVFQAIKDNGQWDSTIVVFLSDNGASPENQYGPGFDRPSVARDGKPIVHDYEHRDIKPGDEHGFYYIGRDWAQVANTPYRRAKASQYNGGERTPMIVHWPAGMIAAKGSWNHARGHVMDLMATALDAAGTTLPSEFNGKTPRPLAGRSLLPLLKGEADRPDYPTLFGEHEGGRSVLTADGWKLIKDRGEKEWHLFHVAVDQTENDDLIEKESDRASKMKAMWDQWAKDNNVLPKP